MFKPLLALALLIGLLAAHQATAQEQLNFEGYLVTSGPEGAILQGRGLVTAIFAPLSSNFVSNEYTWVIDGLVPTLGVGLDSVFTTLYDTSHANFTVYEDPSVDARPTFYNCPSDIVGPDARYDDGSVFLHGHYLSFSSTFDAHAGAHGAGSYSGRLVWDGGSHLAELPPSVRTTSGLPGTTTTTFACIPAGFTEAVTGRLLPLTVASTTWGRLRSLYR